MITTKPLSAAAIRMLTRRHANLFAMLLDTFPRSYDLKFDDAVSAMFRLLMDHGQAFCDMVAVGSGLTDAEIQASSWAEVVKIGAAIVEETRDTWRAAWPNGFLQAIVLDELRPYSSFAQGMVR